MSILIKDMNMPTSCPCELIGNGYDMWCSFAAGIPARVKEYDECCQNGTRPSWCPLIPVPPHGRLRKRIVYRGEVYNAIEAARVNALDGILSDRYKDGFHDGLKRALEILANVKDAPTIIEVEEGE